MTNTSPSFKVIVSKLSGGISVLRVNVTNGADLVNRTAPSMIIQVIDVSGSMAGSPTNALNAHLVDSPPPGISAAIASGNVRRIIFNTVASEDKPSNHLRAGGGTSFKAAFDALLALIRREDIRNAHVMFLTDGQDGSFRSQKTILSTVSTELIDRNMIIHLLGYGNYHDISIMETIVDRLPNNSTFDFARQSEDLGELISAYSDALDTTSVNADIIAAGQTVSTTIGFDNQPTQIYVDGEIEETVAISYVLNGETTEVYVPVVIDDSDHDETEMTLLHLGYQLDNIRRNDGRPDTEFVQEVETLRSKIKAQAMTISSTTANRKANLTLYLDLLVRINGLLSKTSDAVVGGTSTASRAAALATKHGVKRGIRNRQARRVLQNVTDDPIPGAVLAAVSALPDDIGGDPDEFVDMLSLASYHDAARDGDAMCLGIMINRAFGTSIVDSSQLRISGFTLQLATFDTFESQVETGLLNGETGEAILGGYGENSTKSSGVMKDVRMFKPYNSVFPLYCSPAHWSVAKNTMKYALGHMCTMDKHGFTASQQFVVPFLVLEFMERTSADDRTELFDRYVNQVRLVCLQYMSKQSRDETKGWIDQLKFGTLTRESCPNTLVLVGRALCLSTDDPDYEVIRGGLVTLAPDLLCEEIRRRMRPDRDNRNSGHITETLRTLLNIPDPISSDVVAAIMSDDDQDSAYAAADATVMTPMPDNVSNDVSTEQMKTYISRFIGFVSLLKQHFHLPTYKISELFAMSVWGMYNSLAKSVSEFPSTEITVPPPVGNYDACVDAITRNIWLTIRSQKSSVVINNVRRLWTEQGNTRYFMSRNLVPPFANSDGSVTMAHLHYGNTFHYFLRDAKSAEIIINGQEKLDWLLNNLRCSLNRCNQNSFRRRDKDGYILGPNE